MIDGDTCRANNLDGCRPKVLPKRMGGFALVAGVSESFDTVYVTNDGDGTVSVFPSKR